jgi:hypothetical protein
MAAATPSTAPVMDVPETHGKSGKLKQTPHTVSFDQHAVVQGNFLLLCFRIRATKLAEEQERIEEVGESDGLSCKWLSIRNFLTFKTDESRPLPQTLTHSEEMVVVTLSEERVSKRLANARNSHK